MPAWFRFAHRVDGLELHGDVALLDAIRQLMGIAEIGDREDLGIEPRGLIGVVATRAGHYNGGEARELP